MKPFSFSLQAVRTLRQRQEQLALDGFGRAVQARQAAIDQQQLAERRLAAGQDQLTALQIDGATIEQMNQLRDHCRALEQQLTQSRAACAKAQSAANRAWDILQEARQALQLVDKLYSRQREEYDRELRREEQRQLDELSGLRWLATAVHTQPTIVAWN